MSATQFPLRDEFKVLGKLLQLEFSSGTVARIVGINITPSLAAAQQGQRRPGYKGQVALKGYDNMTGIGTPAGQAFITALRMAEKQGK